MRLRLALVGLLAQRCAAGAAPAADASKDFPAGWCDTQHGTPTRTTGECMCKTACEGNGCRREQGFIWYSYASCPTCKCVAGTDAGAAEPEEDEDEPPPPDPIINDDEPSLGEKVYEFVDDHGEKVLALLFVALVLMFVVPAVLLKPVGKVEKAPPPATKAPAKAAPAKAAPAKPTKAAPAKAPVKAAPAKAPAPAPAPKAPAPAPAPKSAPATTHEGSTNKKAHDAKADARAAMEARLNARLAKKASPAKAAPAPKPAPAPVKAAPAPAESSDSSSSDDDEPVTRRRRTPKCD